MRLCRSTHFLQGALLATIIELLSGSADGGLLLFSQLGLVLSDLLRVIFLLLHVFGGQLLLEGLVSYGPLFGQ